MKEMVFICRKCLHEWTEPPLSQEELERARRDNTPTRMVRCPRCGSTDLLQRRTV